MIDQKALCFQATAIALQIAISCNHAVAGNNDGEQVGAVRSGNGADGWWIPKPFGKLRVGDGLAIRNSL